MVGQSVSTAVQYSTPAVLIPGRIKPYGWILLDSYSIFITELKQNNCNLLLYRVFIKYCILSLKFCDVSELCQFCCSAGGLPAWCVYTHCHHRGKTEKGQSPGYLKIFGKKHNI